MTIKNMKNIFNIFDKDKTEDIEKLFQPVETIVESWH